MEKKRMIAILVVLSVFGACSHDSPGPEPEKVVSLKGAIGYSTRAVVDDGYEKELEICFCRQDDPGFSSGTYNLWSRWEAVRSGGSGSRPIRFAVPQLYPEDGCRLRLRGFYPRTGTLSDAPEGKVVFTVDGKTDIMATDLLEGCNVQPVDLCTFSHLLAQLRFACYSDRAAAWGIIRKIEVEGVPVRRQLSLVEETMALSAIDSNKEEVQDLTVNEIANLPMPEVAEGGKLPAAQGYILLPSDTGQSTYRIRVTTSRDGYGMDQETVHRATVSMPEGWEAAKIHRIALFFTDNRLEVASVRVTEWSETDGGETDL